MLQQRRTCTVQTVYQTGSQVTLAYPKDSCDLELLVLLPPAAKGWYCGYAPCLGDHTQPGPLMPSTDRATSLEFSLNSVSKEGIKARWGGAGVRKDFTW